MNIGTRIGFGNAYSDTRILISIPTTGWVHKLISQYLLQLLAQELHENRCHIDIIMPTNVPFENNLHTVVEDIRQRDYTHWISFDSDNPPMKNVVDLVFLDKDIIGCPTPVWHFTGKKLGERPIYWNGYDYYPPEDGYKEHDPKEGLQKVDAVGTGCLIVRTAIFNHALLQTGCFARQLNANGTVYKGNDISFCERARSAGFEIYCHYGYPCRHFVEVELNEVARAFGAMLDNV